MKLPIAKIEILDQDIQRVNEVLKSGWIMQGPRVEEFEQAVARFCEVPHAIATSSGTTALHLALEAIGITAGDEVIVPSFSWIASANSIRYCNATPVFCDVDPETYNMSPEAVQSLVTSRTKAILIVHQFGMPCDLEGFAKIAQRHQIQLIEDAACAIGSLYRNEPIGNCRYTRASCLSFHPRKVVTTGEGGMILTHDKDLAEKVKSLRSHGMSVNPPSDSFPNVGYNYRMTDMQAALGIGQIHRLPSTIQKRRLLAQMYHKFLSKHSDILLPREPDGVQSNFQSYMIRFKGPVAAKRDHIAAGLANLGIASRKSIAPIHQQPCYASANHVELPQTDRLFLEGLVLPLFGEMDEKSVHYVCEGLAQVVKNVCK